LNARRERQPSASEAFPDMVSEIPSVLFGQAFQKGGQHFLGETRFLGHHEFQSF
jgi:hypothetical protein